MKFLFTLLLEFLAAAQLAHSSTLPISMSSGNHTQMTSQHERRWDYDDWNCRGSWGQWCQSNCWDYNFDQYGGGGAGFDGRYPLQGVNGYFPNGFGGRGGYDTTWPGHDYECYQRCYSPCDDNQDECAAPPPLSVLFSFLTPLFLVFVHSVNYFLYESSSGYALFERLESEEIGSKLADVAAAASDLTKFGKMVKLKSFAPFKSAAHALENMNDVSEGIMNDHLKAFLEMNLPKPGKKSKVVLGVTEKSLAGSIKEGLGYDVDASEIVLDLVRGVRLFGDKLLKQLKEGDLERAQLGLGHSYSRGK
ncbi:snoRNP complex protein nop56, partial [Podila minutissima]